jgi:hypothetical protein
MPAARTSPVYLTDLVHPPYRAERFVVRLRRRLRDLLVMGIVGPVTGVTAVIVLQVASELTSPPVLTLPPLQVAPAMAPRPALVPPLVSDIPPQPPAPPPLVVADFGSINPTPDVRHMADWVVERHDNGKAPFFIIDKRDARLYVFEASGRLVDAAPVLLGAAKGDDSWPGIGNVPIKDVKPYQRTTPAGRFITQPGLDLDRKDVVWIDYDAAVAMHRVINKVRAERRPERLASPSPLVKRISFGCINVPIPFFDNVVSPMFGKRPGIAYILPEVKTFHEAFEETSPAPAMAALEAKPQSPAPVGVR